MSTTPYDASAHAAETEARVARDYAEHELRGTWTAVDERNGGLHAWYLRRPDTRLLEARLIVTGARLIIVGDGPEMIFRAASGGLDAVQWLAESNVDYLADLALAIDASACRGARPGRAFDPRVCEAEWRDAIARAEADAAPDKDGVVDEGARLEADRLEEALESWEADAIPTTDAVVAALYEAHVADASEYTFGEVVAPEVYRARALARRLVVLLDARHVTADQAEG